MAYTPLPGARPSLSRPRRDYTMALSVSSSSLILTSYLMSTQPGCVALLLLAQPQMKVGASGKSWRTEGGWLCLALHPLLTCILPALSAGHRSCSACSPGSNEGDQSFSLIQMCPYPGPCVTCVLILRTWQESLWVSKALRIGTLPLPTIYPGPRTALRTDQVPNKTHLPAHVFTCVYTLCTAVSLAEGSSLWTAKLWNGCEPANPQRTKRCLGFSGYCTVCQVRPKGTTQKLLI